MKPCNNFLEDWAVCDDCGDPKGQCLNCGFKDFEHSLEAMKNYDDSHPDLSRVNQRLRQEVAELKTAATLNAEIIQLQQILINQQRQTLQLAAACIKPFTK